MLLPFLFAFAFVASSTTPAPPAALKFVRVAGDTAPIFATVNGVDILRAPVEAALAARLAVVRQTDPSATALRPSDRRAVLLQFVGPILWRGSRSVPHGTCVVSSSSPTCIATAAIAGSGRGIDLTVLRAEAEVRAKLPRESVVCTMASGPEATVAQAGAWRALPPAERDALIQRLVSRSEGACFSTAHFARVRVVGSFGRVDHVDAVLGPVDVEATAKILFVDGTTVDDATMCTVAVGAEATAEQATAWRALTPAKRRALLAGRKSNCVSARNINEMVAFNAVLAEFDRVAPDTVVGPVDMGGTPTIMYVRSHIDLTAPSMDDYRSVAGMTDPELQTALAAASPERRAALALAWVDMNSSAQLVQLLLNDLLRDAKVTLVDAPMTWDELMVAPD